MSLHFRKSAVNRRSAHIREERAKRRAGGAGRFRGSARGGRPFCSCLPVLAAMRGFLVGRAPGLCFRGSESVGTMKRIFVALAIVAVALAPAASPAVPIVSSSAGCSGYVAAGQTASCRQTVNLVDERRASALETHGNFHAAVAEGTITLRWIDAANKPVATYVCTAVGLYITVGNPTGGSSVQAGPADLASQSCALQGQSAATYAKGTQTVIVEAAPTSCDNTPSRETRCLFHGFVSFNSKTIPV